MTSIPGAGVSVAVLLPLEIAAVAEENAMQLAKASRETWIEPVQAPAVVWPVSEVGSIATVNVTAIVEDASGAAPSPGTVIATSGGPSQVPLPLHCTPPS